MNKNAYTKTSHEHQLTETAKEYTNQGGAKIIPFPGVILEQPEEKFQNDLDDFLREMGYIE